MDVQVHAAVSEAWQLSRNVCRYTGVSVRVRFSASLQGLILVRGCHGDTGMHHSSPQQINAGTSLRPGAASPGFSPAVAYDPVLHTSLHTPAHDRHSVVQLDILGTLCIHTTCRDTIEVCVKTCQHTNICALFRPYSGVQRTSSAVIPAVEPARAATCCP
jgi:hypothetical protein